MKPIFIKCSSSPIPSSSERMNALIGGAHRMSASELLPLNMQNGAKHVHPTVELRKQIASGSLIHWSLEGPN